MAKSSLGLWLALCGGLLLATQGVCAATTFYVDSVTGADTKSGTSATAAWATLKNINEHTFQPGDQILLRAGQTWVGTIAPRGSGTTEAPIVLGRYGEGAKPVVQGNGAAQAIYLSELSYWTVQDIAVTNHGARVGIRNGIEVHVSHKGLATGIHLMHVDVSDVNGEVGSKSSGGIGVLAWPKNGNGARFDDLLIDHCTVKHVDGQGIWFHVKGNSADTDDEDDSGQGFPNTRVRITGTTVADTGRNAIFLRSALNASIDHNVVQYAASRTHGNAVVIAWSKGTVVRNNEVSNTGTAGGGENGAFDADDGAINTLFEYNWTHNNAGGSVNIVNDPRKKSVNSGTVVRYNLSENEKNSVFSLGGAVTNTSIYNNTVFIGKGHAPKILQVGRFVSHVPGNPDSLFFVNNVIYSEGGGEYPIEGTHIAIDSNCYLGKSSAVWKADLHKVTGNPGFVGATLPVTSWTTMDSYRLAKDSACAQAAVVKPADDDGLDILGDKSAAPVRGALALAK